tara:strand:+ start:3237 stop:3896 length:660 start_codon:yes stop_codon:yes gene_type:complete
MALKKIKLYGKLRKFIGQASFMADVKTPAEAFRFLLANFPQVESHFYQHHYRIKMGETEISEDLLHMKSEDDISIIPIVTGSGFIFAAGAAIFSGAAAAAATVATAVVATAAAIGGAVVAGATALAASGALGSIATTLLTSLAIDGITSLLTPTVDMGAFDDSGVELNAGMQASNFAFNGIANISRSGIALPVVYGERFVGSIVVSNGVDTVQIEGTAD